MSAEENPFAPRDEGDDPTMEFDASSVATPTTLEQPRPVSTVGLAPDDPDTSHLTTGRNRPVLAARPARSKVTSVDDPIAARPHRRPRASAAKDQEAGAQEAGAQEAGAQEARAQDTDEPTLVDLKVADDPLEATAASPAPSPRRRVKWGRWVALVLVIALVVGAVVGVRWAEGYARRTANAQISGALGTAFNTTATAQVTDASVLKSLYLRKKLEGTTFEAPSPTLMFGEDRVKFENLSGTATNITNPRDVETAVIGEFDATATMSYTQLSKLADVTVHPAGEGRVRIDRPIRIFGATINVQITALPVLDPATRKISLEEPKARASSIPVPGALIRAALRNHQDKMVLPKVPHLVYEKIEAGDKFITITVTGRDVPVKELQKKR